jgi:hypothetical protein
MNAMGDKWIRTIVDFYFADMSFEDMEEYNDEGFADLIASKWNDVCATNEHQYSNNFSYNDLVAQVRRVRAKFAETRKEGQRLDAMRQALVAFTKIEHFIESTKNPLDQPTSEWEKANQLEGVQYAIRYLKENLTVTIPDSDGVSVNRQLGRYAAATNFALCERAFREIENITVPFGDVESMTAWRQGFAEMHLKAKQIITDTRAQYDTHLIYELQPGNK